MSKLPINTEELRFHSLDIGKSKRNKSSGSNNKPVAVSKAKSVTSGLAAYTQEYRQYRRQQLVSESEDDDSGIGRLVGLEGASTSSSLIQRLVVGEYQLSNVLSQSDDMNIYMDTYHNQLLTKRKDEDNRKKIILTKWQIKVKPNCETSESNNLPCIGVFISPVDNEKELSVTYMFAIRSISGELVNKSRDNFTFPKQSSTGRGWNDFVTHGALINAGNGFLHNTKHLRLHCEIEIELEEKEWALPVPAPSLNKDLRRLLQAGTSADITLLVDEGSFPVHRAILAARSPVLKHILCEEQVDRTQDKLVIEECDVGAAQQLLHYLYTDTCPDINTHADTLLLVAEKYELKRLAAMCANTLLQNITREKLIPLLHLATHSNVPLFKDKLFQYMSQHSVELTEGRQWEQLLKEHPEIVSELVRWQSKVMFQHVGVKSSSV